MAPMLIAHPNQLRYCEQCRLVVAAHAPCKHVTVARARSWPTLPLCTWLACAVISAVGWYVIVVLGRGLVQLVWGGR